jgi:hypothetical protein
MFGTLYIPHEKEELKYGLNEKNPNPHTTLKDAYITSIFPEKKLTPKKKRQFALGFK